ncbi:MAG TPA: polyribonucleotide nucleotidyltransferase [Candidatus Lambdaproteobacteria bacterium]|nr:polyribonucleotide nucleotidyltransferase [SAR324 cluster bacterium]HHZ78998.1 polyribonucleotide nucleotidyltransferase [Candidatus Lambdaproteobacteria bacterium]HIN47375.1 polyribonucleotide nucleotidyltransferase [Deltaproteobacteria bacterium]HIA57510.1 polyribonucleotide nucleotidyltransferase [Candidatus Lambdaproteobacteria bacterium]HIB46405.1 polyribonucleotide nucleotidyltransferase [Candidatus Lambdaproteobacteria bacterium]
MKIVEREFGPATMTLETGRMAKQANGSVLVTYGDTVVLVAATAAKGSGTGADFFPLSVFYVEKAYAAGRIPGGFLKREARLSDSETLISRIIDRPLRPAFEDHYLAETMIAATVLSHDLIHPSDVAAMNGASAALAISDIPFHNPLGGVRVGRIDGNFVTNPSPKELEVSELNIFMAASKDAILMVEGESNGVSESVMLDALWYGQEAVLPIIEMQEELMQSVGKTKRTVVVPTVDAELKAKIEAIAPKRLNEALSIKDKIERYERLDTLRDEISSEILGDSPEADSAKELSQIFADIKKDEMRARLIKDQIRIDGRNPTEIRAITCETKVLPRTHGSALFTRGETQALAVTTLGAREDEKMIDSLDGVSFKRFMLHYNFPSFCVGEARPPRGPGRREIGHGTLAERGLTPVLPTKAEFPYTIRLVSEILESNGSSSMATVCAGSLAMMDAGVPLKEATAGIAMGLISDGKNNVILSDILGDEDHLGDMDFKVVGTEKGITALQMDIKIKGLGREIVEQALMQAREGRLHILGKMAEALKESRSGLSTYAPRFITHKIAQDKIGAVIGPGGKMIKSIVEKTGVKINIDDDGIVSIMSRDHQAVDDALEIVKNLTRTIEIGETYTGPVKKVMDFGAFVEVFPGTEGLVHISNLAEGRVEKVTDICKEGDIVTVKATGLDRRGKIQLSIKDV